MFKSRRVRREFARYISEPKLRFFQKKGLNIQMCERSGIYFYDQHGRQYMNCHCNGGVFNLGHRNPRLIARLKQALDEFDIGNHHLISAVRTSLARELVRSCGRFSSLSKVTFASGGGEAMDLAIKLARGLTGRNSIVSLSGGYHGHTGLAVAAGDLRYRDVFQASLPNFRQIRLAQLKDLERLDPCPAALIMETAPATAGMVILEKDLFQEVRKITRRRNIVLILDEVQTGLGRSGKPWCFQHYDIEPDIFITGKGLSGGLYPIAATIYQKRFETLFRRDPFVHISTFGGAEVGCPVALEVLKMSFHPAFLAEIESKGNQLEAGLKAISSAHPSLKSIRRKGLFAGIVFVDAPACFLAIKALLECGIFSVYANNDKKVLQFLPPLIISTSEIEELLDRFRKAMELTRTWKYRMMHKIIQYAI
ncbi:MAG: aspartate aminotransferase family protein [Spirochaetales bacterium]|nr:aspartate aminotransferase family protein [Spirochaetales bacterium]